MSFSDVVVIDGASGKTFAGKSLTTPDDLHRGVFDGLRDAAEQVGVEVPALLAGAERMVHATTQSSEDSVRRIAERIRAGGYEAAAIALLFSHTNPQHERRAREILEESLPGVYISLSADVAPREAHVSAGIAADAGPSTAHLAIEDVVVVVKGRLSVEVAGVWHQLGAGDSIYFSSELPHRWRNPGGAVAEAIWASAPPSF